MKKKVFVMMGMLLMLGMFWACSSDEDENGKVKELTETKSGGFLRDQTGYIYYDKDLQAWSFHCFYNNGNFLYYPIELEDDFKVEGLPVSVSGNIYINEGEQRSYIEIKKIEKVLSLIYNKELQEKSWLLVSYWNGSKEVSMEANDCYFHITFTPSEAPHGGNYSAGQGYGNQMWGDYQCSENEIQLSNPVFSGEDPNLDEFFKDHLHGLFTYQSSDKELRLYNSEGQYFRFIIVDDKSSEDLLDGWLSETDEEIASDPNSIVGIWEFYTLSYTGYDVELPFYQRDVFIFNSKGQVKVFKRMMSNFPEFPFMDGEYDYSYDKEKMTIRFCGKTRDCVVSDGEIHMDGSGHIHEYVFIKKQI